MDFLASIRQKGAREGIWDLRGLTSAKGGLDLPKENFEIITLGYVISSVLPRAYKRDQFYVNFSVIFMKIFLNISLLLVRTCVYLVYA